jgi:hypothetical protein
MSSRKGVFLSENCGADRGTGWRLLLRLREFRVIFDPYNNSGCQIYMSVNRFQTVVDVKNLATAKTEAKAQECLCHKTAVTIRALRILNLAAQ